MIRIAPLILSLILSTLLIPASGRAQGLQDVAQIQWLIRNGFLLESPHVLFTGGVPGNMRATRIRDRGRGGVVKYALMVQTTTYNRLTPVNSPDWERVDLLSACLKAHTEAARNDCVRNLRVVDTDAPVATSEDLNDCFAGKGKKLKGEKGAEDAVKPEEEERAPFLGIDDCLAEYGIVRSRFLPVFDQRTEGLLTQGAGEGYVYFVRLTGEKDVERGMDVGCVERWTTLELRRGSTSGELPCHYYQDAVSRSVAAVPYLSPLLLTPPVQPGSATLP